MCEDFVFDAYALKKWQLVDVDIPNTALQNSIQAVRLAITDQLTDVQRRYIMAYIFEGFTLSEIASEYGVNKSSVSRSVKAGMKKIHTAIRYSNPVFMKNPISYDRNKRVRRQNAGT